MKNVFEFSSQADLDVHKTYVSLMERRSMFSSQADLDVHKTIPYTYSRPAQFSSQADLDVHKTAFICGRFAALFSSQADLDEHKTTAEYKRKISESSSPTVRPVVKECGCERFSHCNCSYYSLPNNDPRRGAPPASDQIITPYQSPPIPRIPPFRGNPSLREVSLRHSEGSHASSV